MMIRKPAADFNVEFDFNAEPMNASWGLLMSTDEDKWRVFIDYEDGTHLISTRMFDSEAEAEAYANRKILELAPPEGHA
jgi:hypothetical protein